MFSNLSVKNYGQSCIGQEQTYTWTAADLGASAIRSINALETNVAIVANNLASVIWDLKMLGILQ